MFFLTLPAFLCGKTHFIKEEAVCSRKISSCRIHVERVIERLRTYKIVRYIDAPLRPFADNVIQVCAVLVNVQSPLLAGIFQEYIDMLVAEYHTE